MVYVLNVVDRCSRRIWRRAPRRRLKRSDGFLYVAMTRARDNLYLMLPHRFYTRGRPGGDNHIDAPRTRFIPDALLPLFERRVRGGEKAADAFHGAHAARVDVQARLRDMWRWGLAATRLSYTMSFWRRQC